jgi:uncharacterized repeat protein (TIGR03803 family)
MRIGHYKIAIRFTFPSWFSLCIAGTLMSDALCGSQGKGMKISRSFISIIILVLMGWSERGNGQTLTTLWQFSGGGDGAAPVAGLVEGSGSNFFGTTQVGGASGSGTVFSVSSSGGLTNLWSFTGGMDGGEPSAGLALGIDGNFYGTTVSGGANGWGTVFKITPAGTLTTLAQFNFATNGANPVAGLVQGSDDNFYGTTLNGGAARLGTVFQITPSGTLTTLFNFEGVPNGSNPGVGLVQGSDSNFYGSTRDGGTFDAGMAFKITSAGTLSWLASFAGDPDDQGGSSALVQGSDSNFYGTTFRGGEKVKGTVFAMTSQGTLTTLNSLFVVGDAGPIAGLVEGSDGDFYGTTAAGGIGFGALFKITSAGTLTTLYNFTGGADGAGPDANLVQGSDGNFYGTTSRGGTNNAGTIFQLIPPCTYTLSTGLVTVVAIGDTGTLAINSEVVSPDATNCTWTATNNVDWIAITSTNSGEGDGTISYSVDTNPDASGRTGTVTIADQTFTVEQIGATVLTYSFSNVVQSCKSKTKIQKKVLITNVTCTVSFDLIVNNTGVTNSRTAAVQFWGGQGSNFNPSVGALFLGKNVSPLAEDKIKAVKIKAVFKGDQSGTFIFATDTNRNVLASVEVP